MLMSLVFSSVTTAKKNLLHVGQSDLPVIKLTETSY